MTNWALQHWYLLGALVIQVSGTHKLKLILPLGLSDFLRTRLTEGISAGLGFMAGTGMMLSFDQSPDHVAMSLWTGIVLAPAGPMLYKVAVAALYSWKPGLKGTLSGDDSVRIARKLVKTADGTLEERDAATPSGDGEKTVASYNKTISKKPEEP